MTIAEANGPFSIGLKIIISELGFKQVHVAAKAGYKEQDLSDMIRDRKIIKACDLVNLSRVLNVTIDDIYAAGIGEKRTVDLKGIKTCELVGELRNREGVREEYAEPHQDYEIAVNGPAHVLIVFD